MCFYKVIVLGDDIKFLSFVIGFRHFSLQQVGGNGRQFLDTLKDTAFCLNV
jgi:hypothetical protein